MRLELAVVKIRDVQFGETTRIENGVLYVRESELIALALRDPRLAAAEVELARPGESVRIIPVKDVIEPRIKEDGPEGYYPGMAGGMRTAGSGRTNVLRGTTVMTVGRIVGYQGGFVDMTGPGAAYSPFSNTNNVALILHPVDGLPGHAHEEAVRLAGLRAAAYLAEASRGVVPDESQVYELGGAIDPALPRVAHVYPMLSQGLLHDTYLYGADAKSLLPTLIHPNEVLDGAIVSGNCVSACDKHTTFDHLNNPVIKELYRRHGSELNFVGVVVTNLNVTLADKERSSGYAAKLVKLLGADGAVITKEGFGNPDADVMMLCKKMEDYGIRTVLITDEYAGSDGSSQSLADTVPQADAVVSVGNANAVITLPPMGRIIGDLRPAEVIAGGFVGSVAADGALSVEIQAIMGSTCQLGPSRLAAQEY